MTTAQQSSINPVFAGYSARQLQDAVGGIQRVFDNLLEIARGNDPDANTYDRLRATRVLYDRGFGKVTRTQPQPPINGSKPNEDSPKPESKVKVAAESTRPVAKLEQKLDEALGPPQSPNTVIPAEAGTREAARRSAIQRGEDTPPIRLDEPGQLPDIPGYTPDLVREAQYYVLEITNYGAELASILAYIHEPDPEDTSIRPCHRITAGQMILDRILGVVADLEQPLDHWHDPSVEPGWTYKHPAEIDSTVPLEDIIEADRSARKLVEGMKKEREQFIEEHGDRDETGPCRECRDDYPCEYHEMAEEFSKPEEEVVMTARGMRNLGLFRKRLYMDENGSLRLRPPDHIDDS